jgi:hypothetical protein
MRCDRCKRGQAVIRQPAANLRTGDKVTLLLCIQCSAHMQRLAQQRRRAVGYVGGVPSLPPSRGLLGGGG